MKLEARSRGGQIENPGNADRSQPQRFTGTIARLVRNLLVPCDTTPPLTPWPLGWTFHTTGAALAQVLYTDGEQHSPTSQWAFVS